MQRKVTEGEAIARKYPEQVVAVLSRGADGRANIMAVGWTGIVSGDPLMFMLAIDEGAHTYALIRQTRSFVVAYPSERMGAAILHAGSVHGHNRDKLAETGLATSPAARVSAPLLNDAVANFECELADIVQPGDCPVIFGRVVAAHINTDPGVKRLYTVGSGHTMGGVQVISGTVTTPPGV